MRVGKMFGLLLGLILAGSALSAAGQYVAYVPSPNGTDDTAAIQLALDTCVQQHPSGCTVQLGAGTYHTRQLVSYNFHGTFKGLGMDRTTIEALPDLPVTLDFLQPCQPNTTTCLWPTLMIFVDGDINISDFSIHVTATDGRATAPWPGSGAGATFIETGIRLMGQYSTTNVHVDRFEMEGRPDSTSGFGFNVNNGIMYTGELSSSSANPLNSPCGAPGGFYFLSGSYAVRNSSFKSMGDGVSQDGCVRSSQVTIGGSPSTGNTFENHNVGIDLESAENSNFEVSYNVSSGIVAAMWVIPWISSVFIPSSPSRYLIHDNKFAGTGQSAEGFYFWNEPNHPWIHAAAWNNIVELQNTLSCPLGLSLSPTGCEGISTYNTSATAILNNSVTGIDGLDAVGLHNSSFSTVIHNNVSDFTVDRSGGLAQIYLDPGTTRDLVVCSTPSDSVLNQGSDNVVVGCQQPASTPEAETRSEAPGSSVPHPRFPRGKPSPYRP